MSAADFRDNIAMMIELPGVYDGVSVYQMKDGTYVNRWDELAASMPDDRGIARRRELAQEWIDAAVIEAAR